MSDKEKEALSEEEEIKQDASQESEKQVDEESETGNTEETEGTETLSEVEKLQLEKESLNDKYLRLYSEFDNFRRRTQKEKLELYKTAGEDIFKSLLPVMDDFERARKSMDESQDYESLKTGVDLIYNKLLQVFKANGAEPMESTIGKDFDSEIHEAVTQVPAPEKKMKGKVIDEVEKGYLLKDKVIRYAKVVVGQ
jgi:molecular chaperone GrpE